MSEESALGPGSSDTAPPDGSEWAALDIWKKDRNQVRHSWAGESDGTADPGQDAHGAPDPMPLWNILDLTPNGRGTDWYPKLEYSVEESSNVS